MLDSRPFSQATMVPRGVAEARAELSQARIDIALIQAQLASRPKPKMATDAESQEWREWHARAASAAHYKSARVQFLTNWLRDQPRPSTRLVPLILHIAVLLDEMLGDETDDLSPAALEALAEMRSWMQEAQLQQASTVSNGVAH